MATESKISPKIHFSVELAEAERAEKNKSREPFRADIGGRVIEMTDAADLDWKVLAAIEDPIEFIKFCASEEDRQYLREAPIQGAVFGELIKAYQTHFGIGDTGKSVASRF